MSVDRAEALADQVTQLRRELSLAEEGLANYAQENERLRGLIDRALEWQPVFPLETSLIDEMWKAIEKKKPRSILYPSNEQIREAIPGDIMPMTTYKHHPFETKCRSCDALIVWFETAAGKRMPVNAETTKPSDAEHQLDLKRHISHFATCPNADDHRKVR